MPNSDVGRVVFVFRSRKFIEHAHILAAHLLTSIRFII